MKKVMKSILIFVLLFSFSGCKKDDSCNCPTDIYNEEKLIKTIKNQFSLLYEEVVNQTVTVFNGDSLGSGFVIDEDNEKAYIMTNAHVVSNAQKSIEVLHPNQKRVVAELFEMSPANEEDLAIITINKSANYEIATFANYEETKMGDQIFAIGSPLSVEYRGSISSGIISAKDVNVIDETVGFDRYMMMVDVTINPGNSGGPLYNMDGEVVGINTLKSKHDSSNPDDFLNFAIPADRAQFLYEEYFKPRTPFVKPRLKIKYKEITSLTLKQRNLYGISPEIEEGLYVYENNDVYQIEIIIGIFDKKVSKASDLELELFKQKPGTSIQLKVVNKENTEEKTIIAAIHGND